MMSPKADRRTMRILMARQTSSVNRKTEPPFTFFTFFTFHVLRFANLVDQIAGGVALRISDDRRPPAVGRHDLPLRDRFRSVVGSLGMDVRLQLREERRRSFLVADDDGVHALECRDDLRALALRQHRPARS